MLKKVREKTEAAWTTTKKTLALMSCWGLVFSLATIGKLGVAFEYDDGLVFSTPAYDKAFANVQQPFSPEFWSVLNRAYDIEKPKIVPYAMAWAFRILGFKVAIMADRPSTDADGLRKEWRRLTPKTLFCFVRDRGNRRAFLERGNYILYFGSDDSGIVAAREAGVYPLRIRRGFKSIRKDDYRPGTLGELMIPLSQY